MSRLLFVVVFICFLDLFIELPIITPFAFSLGATEYIAGVIVAAYSFFNLIGNVSGGYLSDKIGRRNILIAGMAVNIVALMTYSLIDSVEALLFLRVIHGFSAGMLTPVAFSLVADLSRREAMGRSMALTGISIGSAAVLGPALGGIISSLATYQTVYFVLGCIYIIGILLVIFTIKESMSKEERTFHNVTSYRKLLLRPSLIIAYISSFTLMVANGSLAFGLPIKVSLIGLEDHVTGMLLSVFGLTAILVFATRINVIYSKIKSMKLVLFGIFIVSMAMVMLHFAPSRSLVLVVMIIYGAGFALIFPSMNKIIAENTEIYERGKANGIFYAFFSIGSVAGSYSSGIFTTYFDIPFVFIGIILMVMLIVIVTMQGRYVAKG